VNMDWKIGFSRQAERFLSRNHLPDEFVSELLAKAVRRFSGEIVALDLKRLSSDWEGFFRIRSGKKRIIFSIDMHEQKIHVEIIDFRGSAYKH